MSSPAEPNPLASLSAAMSDQATPGSAQRVTATDPRARTGAPSGWRAEALPGALTRSWALRVARRALLLALVVSVLLHAAGLWSASRIVFGLVGGGDAGPLDTSLPLARGPDLQQLMAGSVDVSTASLADLAQIAAPAQPELAAVSPLPTASDPLGALPASGSGAGEFTGLAPAGGGSSGGSGGVSFFGVEARGDRIAFVVDISGSMSLGGRITTLQAQLIKSIGSMVETGSFVVYAYSDDVTLLGQSRGWTQAVDDRKQWARRNILNLRAAGGTQPLPAFRETLRLRPRPDAIYFMTDGDFPESIADEIRALNNTRIPIHCIAFADEQGKQRLERIARDSGGTYTFVAEVVP